MEPILTTTPVLLFKWRRQQIVFEEIETLYDGSADIYTNAAKKWIHWLDKNPGVGPFEAARPDLRGYLEELATDGYARGSIEPRLNGVKAFYRSAESIRKDQEALRAAGRDVEGPEVPSFEDPTEDVSLGDISGVPKSTKQNEALEVSDDHHKLSQEEVDLLAENAPKPKDRNSLIIRLMYRCCLRRSELVALTVDHVDVDRQRVEVPAVKNDKPRDMEMPISAGLAQQLSLWLSVQRQGRAYAAESDYLFPTSHGPQIHPDVVSRVVSQAAEAAPVDQGKLYTDAQGRERKRIHSHTLRASGAHRLWDNTGDIYLVARALGHRKANGQPAIDTTVRYLDADREELSSKIEEAW